jgi:hypothetical protein
MIRCHGFLGKHDLSVSANGEIACSKCKRRWDPRNDGLEIIPYGYESWEAWRKADFEKHRGQTIYPTSRPETHYGSYKTQLGHKEIAPVYAEHLIKVNGIDDENRIRQIREMAKNKPDEFLRQIFSS